MLGKEGDVAVNHLKCVPLAPEQSAAALLHSICKGSLDSSSGPYEAAVRSFCHGSCDSSGL